MREPSFWKPGGRTGKQLLLLASEALGGKHLFSLNINFMVSILLNV